MMRKTMMIMMSVMLMGSVSCLTWNGTLLIFPHFYCMLHVYMAYNQQYHYQIHNPYDTRHHHLFGHFYMSYKHSLFARIRILC